jgi:hypothetical protein
MSARAELPTECDCEARRDKTRRGSPRRENTIYCLLSSEKIAKSDDFLGSESVSFSHILTAAISIEFQRCDSLPCVRVGDEIFELCQEALRLNSCPRSRRNLF